MIASLVGRIASRSSSFSLAAVRHPRALGREALDVIGLELEQRFGNQHRKVGVLVAGGLDPVVEQPLHVLPQRVAVRADRHAAAHRRVIGELRLADHLGVPAREVVALVGQLLDELLDS
mgnify:CR=1 FL=1